MYPSPPFARTARLFAAAALFLVALPAQANKKVAVAIVARPAQATAVAGWSPGLVGAATTAIDGRPLAQGQTVLTWIGANFAKHHVIPQTYLQAVAGLAVADEAGDGDLRTRLVKAIKVISAGDAGGPPRGWNLGPVVWAPVNLFEGPTEFYRSDDPGEGAEPRRPRSFDKGRWDLLQAALSSLTQVGKMKSDAFESSTDDLNKQQKGGKTGFTMIVEAFEGLAEKGTTTVSPFVATDWVDPGDRAINLADLVVFNDNVIQVTLNPARKHGYQLKP